MHEGKVTVSVAMSSYGLIRSFFFSETLNSKLDCGNAAE
jgi:hypothetical protein